MSPACPYCEATEGLRVAAQPYGSIPADYICEDCFTPSDTGPCFDDLPALADNIATVINPVAEAA